MPRFFYFDLGNVLLFFDPVRLTRQVAAAANIDAQRVWQVLFEGDIYRQYECGAMCSRDFHASFLERVAAQLDFAAFQAAACDVFQPNTAVLSRVQQMHAAGYRLGILSNTNEGHWGYICDGRYPILGQCFEQFALSYQLGAMKPEPEIYLAAARLAGAAPAEVFFVDDRPENVEGALRAGLDAVQYTDAAELARQLQLRGVEIEGQDVGS